MPGYAAAKGGVAQLTKALANEWAGKGVNVNAIAPGYMVTDNTAALRADPTRYRQILERIPAGRWGDPYDLGGAVVLSLVSGVRLCPRPCPHGRWRLDGALTPILSRIRAATIPRRNRMKRILAAIAAALTLARAALQPLSSRNRSLSWASSSPAPDPGKGADLGGLDGADSHCQTLAAAAGAGSRTWRAYLSTRRPTASRASTPRTASAPARGSTRRA